MKVTARAGGLLVYEFGWLLRALMVYSAFFYPTLQADGLEALLAQHLHEAARYALISRRLSAF